MEFLIRPTQSMFFEDISFSDFPRLMRPNSFLFEVLDNSGDYRIKVQECEITFSDEMVGVQINFEGDYLTLETMRKIVAEIADNLRVESAQQVEVIEIEGRHILSF